MRIYGGDVVAGSQFGTPCVVNATDSNLQGYNRLVTSPSNGYIGAGTQYAGFANGTVVGFASMMLNDAVGATAKPWNRIFSNTSASTSNYGGSFAEKVCTTDFWDDKASVLVGNGAASSVDVGTLGTVGTPKQYYYTAPTVTLNPAAASQVPNGTKITLYFEHDVVIANNITTSSNWASLTDIPSFKIVAKGNIYIRPAVNSLDGTYVAMPSNPATPTDGRIVTCAPTNSTAVPAVALVTGAGACVSKLTINGAFVAQKVNFYRTKGTLRTAPVLPSELSSSNNLAEVFQFNAEFYMVKPAAEEKSDIKYDSVVSLPPSL